MARPECCAVGCRNRSGFKFPKKGRIRKGWIGKVRRVGWKPNNYTILCADHFEETDFIQATKNGLEPLRRRLKPDAVPTRFEYSKPSSSAAVARKLRLERRSKAKPIESQTVCDQLKESLEIGSEFEVPVSTQVCNEPFVTYVDNTDNELVTSRNFGTQTKEYPIFNITCFKNNNRAIHFYTGLENYEKFMLVFHTLGEAAFHLNYRWRRCESLSVEDQFFLTLIKLRQHKTDFEIGIMFEISEYSVSNVFVTWVNFMYAQWSELNIWSSKDLVAYYMPSDFKKKFPNTRVILDGTEMPIKKPCNPTSQQATWSSYKNRNTQKVVVGVSPGGAVTYLSSAYGGAASDRQIIERSDLTSKCEKGDSIMADRGLTVQDIFAPYDIAINMPTFLRGKNQLPGLTVLRDRKIASKSFHVERLIGLSKTYKIMKDPLNMTETILGNKIVFLCFMICNFRNCIVNKKC